MISTGFFRTLTALAVGQLALVATAQAAQVDHYMSSGLFANGGTTEYSADGCSMKDVWVSGDERTYKKQANAPQEFSAIWVSARTVNWCEGKESGFFGMLDNASVVIGKGLKTATVSGTGMVSTYAFVWDKGGRDHMVASTVTAMDPTLPPPKEPIPAPMPSPMPPPPPMETYEKASVSVTWTGVGDLARGSSVYKQSFGTSSFSYTTRGTTRDAVAQGVIQTESQTITFDSSLAACRT